MADSIGSSSTVVAVLDSGLSSSQRQYFLHVVPGYDFISNPTEAMDGDGRDSDPSDPWDHSTPHGLQVAGIIAANTPSDRRGVAPNVTINPVRVLGKGLRGKARDVADAIIWASGGKVPGIEAEAPLADMIVMAFSGRGFCPDYLQAAVGFSKALGVRLLAAAGNQRGSTADYFPANCQGVFSVGATSNEEVSVLYSNMGADFTAPGGDSQNPIPTVGVDGAISFLVGTSASVGFAAGQMALNFGSKTQLRYFDHSGPGIRSTTQASFDFGENGKQSQETTHDVEAAGYDSSKKTFSTMVDSGNGGNKQNSLVCSQSSIVKSIGVWYDSTSMTAIQMTCQNEANQVTNTFQYGGTCFPDSATVYSPTGFSGFKVSFSTWIRNLALLEAGSASWQNTIGASVQGAQSYDLSCPSYFFLIGFSIDTGFNCDARMDGIQTICAPSLCSDGTYQVQTGAMS